MNILDAINAVKQGLIVKYEDKYERIYYILQTVIAPLGITELKEIDQSYEANRDELPESVSRLILDDLTNVCVHAILNENFSAISLDAMLKEIQDAWKKRKQEEQEEEE